MKGIDLSRAYYEAYGKDMIAEKFPAYRDRIAVGLAGEGSECLGFDDEISQDHDFGAGFCMWLTDEDEAEIGVSLRLAYESLPQEFGGFPARDPFSFGIQRLSAMRTSDFYRKFTGFPGGPAQMDEWRAVPESFLSAAVSGSVFTDELQAFSSIRARLLEYYPEEIRIEKIWARTEEMARSGPYNYGRCLKRGACAAAIRALSLFIEASISLVYLLNRKYKPYYKWEHRGMKNLPLLPEVHDLIDAVCMRQTPDLSRVRLVGEICGALLSELRTQGLSDCADQVFAER
ncbi:MAG: DUF4037 domain-containing protein [Clostridiales Family XIII bacterium]|nr:DUF4037 domain-containing protein [Clostridiales Family XIII bacterium]